MKNKLLLLTSFVLVVLASCKKDDQMVTYQGGKTPVLSANFASASPYVLNKTNESTTAVTFSWTNPDYTFSTGVSSHDVTYTLQIDTTGSNFTNPDMQQLVIARDLSTTLTVKDLNTILAKMNLMENIPHNMEFRLKSTLENNSVPLFSNVIKMTIVPYLDAAVPVPTNGNLWIVGDATANGWSNPLSSPYDVSQKFTKVSNVLYELVIDMPGGGGYKLLQDNGSWATQYHMVTGTWDAGTFEKKDSDPQFPGPPTKGKYKISVNFKTGKYTVTPQ